MKSLRESLFDIEKNVTKDITFGDVFKLAPGYRDYIITDGSSLYDKYFDASKIKKDMKVPGTHNKAICDGLLKLITNIKFTDDNLTTDLFKEYLQKAIEPYYKKDLSDAYKHVIVHPYKNEHLILNKELDMIGDEFDKILVFPGQILCFDFIRA